jgi:hypothetical protein
MSLEDDPMDENAVRDERPNPQLDRPRVPLPAGYRPAIVTAITVLLGFSLLFLRYWNFELPGAWSASSTLATVLLTLALALEIVTLWRSLQVKDDDEIEYGKTLRWFLAAMLVLLLSLLISLVAYYHVFGW